MNRLASLLGALALVTTASWGTTGCGSNDTGPTTDSGVRPDTSAPAPDTSAPAPDTGTPAPDTGTPAPDTGTPAPDTGTPAPDTGTSAPCNETFGANDACGGDPIGSWLFQSTCTDFDFGPLLQTVCATASVKALAINAQGTLEVTAGTWDHQISGDVTATASFPSSCALVAMGCSAFEGLVKTSVPDTSCSDDGASGCDCVVKMPVDESYSGTYTQSNGVATLDNGDEYFFCINGSSMLLRQKNGDSDEIRPVFALSKN